MPLSHINAMKLYTETTFVVIPFGPGKAVVPHSVEKGIQFDKPLFGTASVDTRFFNLLSAATFMFQTIASSVNVVEELRAHPDMPPELAAALSHFEKNLNLALSCAITGPEAAAAAAHNETNARKPRK